MIKRSKFKVRWIDHKRGEGILREVITKRSFTFYLCNFKDSDSLYPHLVRNIQVKKGDVILGTISSDKHLLNNCGIVNMSLSI